MSNFTPGFDAHCVDCARRLLCASRGIENVESACVGCGAFRVTFSKLSRPLWDTGLRWEPKFTCHYVLSDVYQRTLVQHQYCHEVRGFVESYAYVLSEARETWAPRKYIDRHMSSFVSCDNVNPQSAYPFNLRVCPYCLASEAEELMYQYLRGEVTDV